MRFLLVLSLLLTIVAFSHQQAIQGTIGSIYSLNSSSPIQFQLATHYTTVEVSPAITSVIQGDFFMYNAVVKSGYSVPTFTKSPMTAIAAFSLNLTQVFVPQNTSDSRSRLAISYKSWIPTFYNMDPTTFQLLIYDEVSNSFSQLSNVETLDYGVSIVIPKAFGKIVTIGVFVYNEVEKIAFSKSVSIYYPRSVMFSIGSDLRSLAYSFPTAKYFPSSYLGYDIYVSKYSTAGSVINSNYAVLGRFNYLSYTSGLNFTNAYISVQYQTTSDLFYDVSGGVVSVDPSTISCSLYISSSLYAPVSMTRQNGVLTCFLNSAYSMDHQLFITAKLKNPPNPNPTPTPSSSVPAPIIMVHSYMETVKMAKSEKVLFKISIPTSKKVKFVTSFVSTGSRPKFYIGKDYIPSSTNRDEVLYDGEGTIYNTKSYTISVYLLIVNVDSQANNFYVTPIVSYIDVLDPVSSTPVYFTVKWWVIVAPILSFLGCFVCIAAILIIIIVVTKRNRNRQQQQNNIEFMSGNGVQTSQYYRVQ